MAYEFEKVKEKDDLASYIDDPWFLSDMELVARTMNLFDFSSELDSQVRKESLKRKREEDELDGELCSREVKKVCNDTSRDKVDTKVNTGLKLRLNLKLRTVIKIDNTSVGVSSEAQKKSSDATEASVNNISAVRVGQEVMERKSSGSADILRDGTKKSGVIVPQLSYAEKLERSKLKLQQGYGSYKEGRKKTSLISLSEAPKCDILPKARKNHHVPRVNHHVPRVICGY